MQVAKGDVLQVGQLGCVYFARATFGRLCFGKVGLFQLRCFIDNFGNGYATSWWYYRFFNKAEETA